MLKHQASTQPNKGHYNFLILTNFFTVAGQKQLGRGELVTAIMESHEDRLTWAGRPHPPKDEASDLLYRTVLEDSF